MTVNVVEYRKTIGLFATGVTVLSVKVGDETHGMTANAVSSVSLDPVLLLACIDRRARMAELVVAAGRFAVNILGADQEAIARHFAGQAQLAWAPVFAEHGGVPVLVGSLGHLICRLEHVIDGGDHLIVLGRVEGLNRSDDSAQPLVYYRGRYGQFVGDGTERTAAWSGERNG